MATPLQRIRNGAISLACICIASAIGFHYIGGYDWLQSLWMVVITISTVGYSEHTDATAATQILMILVILLGVTSAAYTFGGFVQLMLEGEVDRVLGRRKMTKELNRLDNHVIICGFGRLGQDLATQLQHRELPFAIVDLSPEKVLLAKELGLLALQGDATSEDLLQQVHLDRARALATALPTDAENVFITLTARNLQPDILIIAKSERESSCRKLRQAGANKIVMPHRVGAQQMERMISRPSTADLVELFAEASHIEMELDELRVTEHSKLVGSTLADSQIKAEFNLLVVGIRDSLGEFRFNPQPQETISAQDTLLVIGEVGNINQLRSSMNA
ncbi:MAG: TrkA family potassium uptake protein [Mariniblastus sp.]